MKSVFRVLAGAAAVAFVVLVSSSFSAQSLEPQQAQKWVKRGYCDRITFANRVFCRSVQASLPPAPAAAPVPDDKAPVVTGALSQPAAPKAAPTPAKAPTVTSALSEPPAAAPTRPRSPLARMVHARNERFVKRGFCDHISDANRSFCKQMGITGAPLAAPAQTASVNPPEAAGAPTTTGSLSEPPTTTGPSGANPAVTDEAVIDHATDTETASTCVQSAWARAGFCRRITAFNRRFCEDVCGPPTVTGAIGAPRVTGAIGGGGNPFGPGGAGTPPGGGDDDSTPGPGPVASNPPTGDDTGTPPSTGGGDDDDDNTGTPPSTGGDDDDDDNTGTPPTTGDDDDHGGNPCGGNCGNGEGNGGGNGTGNEGNGVGPDKTGDDTPGNDKDKDKDK